MKRSWVIFSLASAITIFFSLAGGSLGVSFARAGAAFPGQAQAVYGKVTPNADGEIVAGPAAEPNNNDNFNFPIIINAQPYSNTQSVAAYTVVGDDPKISCNDNDTGYATALYRYTPSENQTLTISTLNSDYDTVLAIWTGTRGSLTSVTCNDDFGGTLQSLVTVNLTAGTTYQIEVASWEYIRAGDPSSLTLNVSLPGEPEIVVKGNHLSIVNGDSTPALTDHTDFGNAVVPGGTVVRTFTIENWGSGSLTLDGLPKVSISGAQAADFTVTVQPTSPVEAGGSTTFNVRFSPSAVGLRSAVVSIANNDSDENPFTFAIQGTGVATPIESYPIYLPLIAR